MSWFPSGRRLAGGMIALVIVGVAAAGVTLSLRPRGPSPTPAAESKAPPAATAARATTVTMPEDKARSAGVKIEEAGTASLPVEVVVSGQIEVNADRRIDVRTRVPGIIRSVSVALGQRVKAGDLLVTLNSADVGTARLNLRSRQRELSVTRIEARWRSQVAANVEEMVPALRRGLLAVELEKKFAARQLGNDRALLLSAYADWQIALHEEEKKADLYKQKIVGENVFSLAEHAREGSQAKFEAALEQVRYDAGRQMQLADQQVRLAESAVTDAAQRLSLLGVPTDPAAAIADAEKALGGPSDVESLTSCPIVAPFDGTIIMRAAVPSQRAEPADVLLALADLSTVRVAANIPESGFSVLPTLKNGPIRLTATAYPGRTFAARTIYVGDQVDPTTRTVALLAETPNADGLLKLGMFVQVAMDSGEAEDVGSTLAEQVPGRCAGCRPYIRCH